MMKNVATRMILITAASFAFTGIASAKDLDKEEISTSKKTIKAPSAEQKASKIRMTKPAEKPDTVDDATRTVTKQSKDAHDSAKKIIDNLK